MRWAGTVVAVVALNKASAALLAPAAVVIDAVTTRQEILRRWRLMRRGLRLRPPLTLSSYICYYGSTPTQWWLLIRTYDLRRLGS